MAITHSATRTIRSKQTNFIIINTYMFFIQSLLDDRERERELERQIESKKEREGGRKKEGEKERERQGDRQIDSQIEID